jgi:pilus assembly protein CpaC
MVSTAVPTGDALHLSVGHSIAIHTALRLKRIYVGNPKVLDSVTETPNDVIISAKEPGTSPLLVTDESGHTRVYYVVSDLNVEGLQSDLAATFPNDHLKAEAKEGRVSVYGTVDSDASAKAVLKLASMYSKDVGDSLFINPAQVQQVRLQVRFVEVDRSKLNQFGINIFSGGNNIGNLTSSAFPVSTQIQVAATQTTFQASDPLNFVFYNTNLNVGAAIRDLENRNILQILAEPNITTLSGQKASFLSGGEFPFPVVQSSGGSFPTVAIQFRSYGVKLDFTPQVNANGTIELHVAPEVSALDYTNSVTIAGFTVPALSTRRADTQVQLRDGQSFAISGLLDRRTTDNLSQVPVLGQLPILGNLFRSKNINRSTVELIVIVTPTIVSASTPALGPQPEPVLPIPLLDPAKFDNKIPLEEKESKN